MAFCNLKIIIRLSYWLDFLCFVVNTLTVAFSIKILNRLHFLPPVLNIGLHPCSYFIDFWSFTLESDTIECRPTLKLFWLILKWYDVSFAIVFNAPHLVLCVGHTAYLPIRGGLQAFTASVIYGWASMSLSHCLSEALPFLLNAFIVSPPFPCLKQYSRDCWYWFYRIVPWVSAPLSLAAKLNHRSSSGWQHSLDPACLLMALVLLIC